MRKKCKVCGAPLTSDRCDYCGTNHGANAQPISTFDQNIPQNDIPKNDIPQNTIPQDTIPQPEVPGFDFPNAEPNYSQPQHGKNSKKSNSGVIIGIVVAIVVVVIAGWFFLSRRFVPYGTHEDSALLGTWGNGRGRIFLLVFNEADYVQFFEDGIVIITEGNYMWYAEWEPGASGTFRANGDRFRYSITGDRLVITDSWNDEWTFDFVAPSATELAESNVTISEADLIGNWVWNFDHNFIYEFNANGTGQRGFPGSRFDFYWEIIDGNVVVLDFWSSTDYWVATIEGNILTLGSLDTFEVWQYLRVGDSESDSTATPPVSIEDSPLLGYWTNGEGRIHLWVFNRADSVEFLEDGTVIITENGISQTISWTSVEPGVFMANERRFTYVVEGDILILTDSANDDWIFDRGE